MIFLKLNPKVKFSALKTTFLAILISLGLNLSAKDFVVVIDAGHGGKDIGAQGSTTNEKTINLNVAKLLGKKICSISDDIKVVYTRETDEFVALNDRASIANRAKGDLFISIHVNSVDRKNKNRRSICGAEVFTLGLHKTESNLEVAMRENSVITLEEDFSETYSGFDPDSAESYIAFELSQSRHLDRSIQFASEVEDELVATAGRRKKGVKQAGFWVLWATGMPSVLIELDFICNPDSEKFMASEAGREKLATAISNAFERYYASVTGNVVARTSQPVKPAAETNDEDSQSAAADSNITESETAANDIAPAEANEKEATPAQTNGIEYRVQILTSGKPLPEGSREFKGITDIDMYRDKNMYKYTVGHFATEREAINEMRRLKSKFPDAFVIKMNEGKRIF